MDENEEVSIWQKKPADLTVADQLKLSAVFTGVVLGIYAVGIAGLAAAGYISERRRAKKQTKLELVQSEDTEQ